MKNIPVKYKRNFSIIAHIDHGKSTLADRVLQLTGALTEREMKEQVLDSMDLERERGITIKSSAVRLYYKSSDGNEYMFHLIDTPGHVDFHYEVSRALAACDGAVILVDATQGVQAQTLANLYAAFDQNLEIIPVINKIDLPNADCERARQEIQEILGIEADHVVMCSAKTGQGVSGVLESVIQKVPPPTGSISEPLQALIFDSWFDAYQGVVMLVRVVNGEINKGDRIQLMSHGKAFEVLELGVNAPRPEKVPVLSVGDVGFVIAGMKDIVDAKVGDTITHCENPCATPLAGFKDVKAMVFCGFYPTQANQYDVLREAFEKLKLNDASFSYEPETSAALGFGFRCGFLGLLHMEIVQERLEREYDVDLVTTAPTVVYHVYTTQGEKIEIDNPSRMPDSTMIDRIEEPFVRVSIHVPAAYVGSIIQLCESRRGKQDRIDYLSLDRVMIRYELPFPEIMYDFYDQLKSLTRGYGSMDYEVAFYQASQLVKLNILINGDPVDALSVIVHRESSYYRGKALVAKLRKLIPRQQFDVSIQAAIGGRIISRETVKALRKDVTAKCYGGDITRKRKLLEKQKEGKKRMKKVGAVEIPQEAFLAALKIE